MSALFVCVGFSLHWLPSARVDSSGSRHLLAVMRPNPCLFFLQRRRRPVHPAAPAGHRHCGEDRATGQAHQPGPRHGGGYSLQKCQRSSGARGRVQALQYVSSWGPQWLSICNQPKAAVATNILVSSLPLPHHSAAVWASCVDRHQQHGPGNRAGAGGAAAAERAVHVCGAGAAHWRALPHPLGAAADARGWF